MLQLKWVGFLIAFFFIQIADAQNNSLTEKEINEQVWKPFKIGYETRNAELFNSIHSDDVLRINSFGITLGPDYKAGIIKRYAASSTVKISIDFSHEHRYYNGDVGYEVGYYRVVYEMPNQEPSQHYGRFHVVLKKYDGQWKITQDWDTDTIGTQKISEVHFLNAKLLSLD